MTSTIKHKRSAVPAKIPTPGQLEVGELAINTADKILYTKNSVDNIVAINDWANIQNKPDVNSLQGVASLYTGTTAPNANDYSFWWNTTTNSLWTAVDDGVNPVTWEETIAAQAGQELHTSSTYPRECLTEARTYYVAVTGSDSNNGLSAGAPFATIQKAVDTVAALDIYLGSVVIQLADGTYNESVTLKQLTGYLSNGSTKVTIQGNLSNMSAVTVSATTAKGCFYGSGVDGWIIRNLRMTSAIAGSYCLTAVFKSVIRFLNIDFGAATTAHIGAFTQSVVEATGNYTISGDAQYHISAFDNSFIKVAARTITLTGTRAFSSAFCNINRASIYYVRDNTFVGSATGSRYAVDRLGIIDAWGKTLTYLPGNTAGTTATGGIYAIST